MTAHTRMLDTTIVVIYFLIVFAIGFYHSRRERTSSDYFLAGQSVGWFAVGASLFATNISSEHLLLPRVQTIRHRRHSVGRPHHQQGFSPMDTAGRDDVRRCAARTSLHESNEPLLPRAAYLLGIAARFMPGRQVLTPEEAARYESIRNTFKTVRTLFCSRPAVDHNINGHFSKAFCVQE